METEKGYVQGFSQGYKLNRYSPDVYELLKESLSEENEFQRGILEGAAEWSKEKEQNRLAELNQMSAQQEQERDEELEQ